MSISDINAAAIALNELRARLNGYLDDLDAGNAAAIAAAQAQLQARQAAYDALAANLEDVAISAASRIVYLDPNTGDDLQDGSVNAPVRTLPVAYAMAQPGGDLTIRIRGVASEVAFVGAAACNAGRVFFSNVDGIGIDRSTFPKITGGSSYFRGSHVEFSGVNLDATTGFLFKAFGRMSVKVLRSLIVAGDGGVFIHHSSEPGHIDLSLTHAEISDAVGASLPRVLIASTWTFQGTSLSLPVGKSMADYINVTRAADGSPLNGISSLTI
jgi:hypothetical protein